MASDVEVHITDRAIISALNTPGGAIFEWRDRAAAAIVEHAIAHSPVNSPLNIPLDGSRTVGTYKASWGYDRVGSNGDRVQATIYNSADHADIVEFGRRSTTGYETFAWRSHVPPGDVQTHRGTGGREGKHVLRNAVNARGVETGDWGPLV